jgi:hypothetical protein
MSSFTWKRTKISPQGAGSANHVHLSHLFRYFMCPTTILETIIGIWRNKCTREVVLTLFILLFQHLQLCCRLLLPKLLLHVILPLVMQQCRPVQPSNWVSSSNSWAPCRHQFNKQPGPFSIAKSNLRSQHVFADWFNISSRSFLV